MHPEILIELDDSQDFRDLGEGEADIALRSAFGDLGSGVVGRRLGTDDWTLYCSRDYAAAMASRQPRPSSKSMLLSAAADRNYGEPIRPGCTTWASKTG